VKQYRAVHALRVARDKNDPVQPKHIFSNVARHNCLSFHVTVSKNSKFKVRVKEVGGKHNNADDMTDKTLARNSDC